MLLVNCILMDIPFVRKKIQIASASKIIRCHEALTALFASEPNSLASVSRRGSYEEKILDFPRYLQGVIKSLQRLKMIIILISDF